MSHILRKLTDKMHGLPCNRLSAGDLPGVEGSAVYPMRTFCAVEGIAY
jgi:hypothetical protein